MTALYEPFYRLTRRACRADFYGTIRIHHIGDVARGIAVNRQRLAMALLERFQPSREAAPPLPLIIGGRRLTISTPCLCHKPMTATALVRRRHNSVRHPPEVPR
jgi:hypothetical protein